MQRRVLVLAILGCNNHEPAAVDAALVPDVPIDAPAVVGNPLGLACAATVSTFAPGDCPAPQTIAGQATFCFRPQWPGTTAVTVVGGFGRADDWTAPLVTLADRGDGVFVGTAAIPNGSYPYLFRVTGAVDHLVRDNQYLLDQLNPQFVPPPAGAPIMRTVSQLTVPQVAPTLHHLRGRVTYGGIAQPCFAVQLDVGELLKPGGGVLSEHYVGNMTETDANGLFDFPIADGHQLVNVRYPFGLFTSYPDPATTPSVGMARQGHDIAGADVILDDAEIAYAGFAALSPTSPDATLPAPFTWSLVDGASASAIAFIRTNIAGNDPAYLSPYGSGTAMTWDGVLGNGMHVATGTQYWWGTWQKRATWTSESLLLPITFH